jgi:hypothetical protein
MEQKKDLQGLRKDLRNVKIIREMYGRDMTAEDLQNLKKEEKKIKKEMGQYFIEEKTKEEGKRR